MAIKPLQDRVVVKMTEAEETTRVVSFSQAQLRKSLRSQR